MILKQNNCLYFILNFFLWCSIQVVASRCKIVLMLFFSDIYILVLWPMNFRYDTGFGTLCFLVRLFQNFVLKHKYSVTELIIQTLGKNQAYLVKSGWSHNQYIVFYLHSTPAEHHSFHLILVSLLQHQVFNIAICWSVVWLPLYIVTSDLLSLFHEFLLSKILWSPMA